MVPKSKMTTVGDLNETVPEMFPRRSYSHLLAFMRQKRDLLRVCGVANSDGNENSGGTSVRFVVGNTSCDQDSVCSAISYSYFLEHTQNGVDTKYPNPTTAVVPQTRHHYVPVLNINRATFPTLLQQNYWLERFGITAEDILFREDLTEALDTVAKGYGGGKNKESVGAGSGSDMNIEIVLVDHNEVDPGQKALFAGRVVGEEFYFIEGGTYDDDDYLRNQYYSHEIRSWIKLHHIVINIL
jgi:hypothetical protein